MELNANNQCMTSYKTVIHSNLEPAIDVASVLNCEACNVSFTSNAKLESHKKKGHSKIQIQCTICHSLFRRRDHLRRHVQTVHCQERLSCPVCNQECKEDELTEHLRVCHPQATQFHCPECQLIIDNLQDFIAHKKLHVLFTKFVCKVCNACFKRQDHLNRHTKSLHLNQFVSCEVCEQIFKRRDHLLRHKREKHGIGVRKRTF